MLELMISLTILAMIVAVMFGGFRVGVRAWEKGEQDVDARQRQRVVLNLIRHQLASICTADAMDNSGTPVLFKGDAKSMRFVSNLPLTPGTLSGRAYVHYVVQQQGESDKERLAFYERSASLPEKMTGEGEPDESDFSELLSGVESIVFEYWKSRPDKEESPWQESWDPATDGGTPQAIRITLKESDDRVPIYVIAAAGS